MKSWLLFSNEPYMRSSLFTIHPASHTRSLLPLCKREADEGVGGEDRGDMVLQGLPRTHETRTVWNASYALTLAHSAHAI